MKELFHDLPNFEKAFKGFNILDCTIRSPDHFYFLGREEEPESMKENPHLFDDTEISYRIIEYFRTEPIDEQLLVVSEVLGFSLPDIEMTYTPLAQVIIYDGTDGCKVVGSGKSEFENTPDLGGAIKATCINDKIYAAHNNRAVRYRTDVETWHQIGDNDISYEYDPDDLTDAEKGFSSVDGFDKNHIYAVGGRGDVWRCINNEWIQCGFPTNLRLNTVCCAGDGNVYVSGTSGITYYGKEDNWTKVEGEEITLSFDDIVWHDDKLWCSNDYGLWWVVDGKLMEADVPSEIKCCSRSLCARFGKLLIAGYGGCALHEDGEWQLFFNRMYV